MGISVTRALAEIKSLDARINEQSTNVLLVAVAKGKDDRRKVVDYSGSVAEIEGGIQANYDRLISWINRRNNLKRAIVDSNAKTTVSLAGVTMTVAEAIERKASIVHEKNLLANMQRQYGNVNAKIAQFNQQLDDQIEKAVTAAYQNDKGKATEEQYKAVAEPRRQEHEASLLDPLKIAEKVDALRTKVADFEQEVDFVLSESNARTMLDIEAA